jgi:hypothetical protein
MSLAKASSKEKVLFKYNFPSITKQKLDSVINCLIEKVDHIVDRQGYVKDKEEVFKIIHYVHRPFIARKYLKEGTSFKAANKLLCSLNQYLYRFDLVADKNTRFDNLFTDYNIFQSHSNFFFKQHDLKEIFSVNVTEENANTCKYKSSKLAIIEDEDAHLTRQLRKKLDKAVRSFPGKKFVEKDVKFLFNFKKKYNTDKELEDDLYKIYANWHQSKVASHKRHVEVNNWIASAKGYCYKHDKSKRRYTLTQDLFMKYVKHEAQCPKRFLNIVKFCSCLRERKAVKNSGYVDKMVELASVINTKENSGVVVPTHQSCRIRANQRMLIWISDIVRDIVKRGYLNLTEAMRQMGDLPASHIGWKKLNWDNLTERLSSKWHSKMFDRRSRKISSSLAGFLVRKISEEYLGEDEGYNAYIKGKKREINIAYRELQNVARHIEQNRKFEYLVNLASGNGDINPELHKFETIEEMFPNSKRIDRNPFRNANSLRILLTFAKTLHQYLGRVDLLRLDPENFEIRPLAIYSPLSKILNKKHMLFLHEHKVSWGEDDVRIYYKMIWAVKEIRKKADNRIKDETHPLARRGIFITTIAREMRSWFRFPKRIGKEYGEDMWSMKIKHGDL